MLIQQQQKEAFEKNIRLSKRLMDNILMVNMPEALDSDKQEQRQNNSRFTCIHSFEIIITRCCNETNKLPYGCYS